MILPAWREVAQPYTDIADGSFEESMFAGDLGTVDSGGDCAEIYREPVTFFEKTYLTDALTTVLGQLAQRLDGSRGVPAVYRMQTGFGGGKTHTLLAAYHLFRDPERVQHTQGRQGSARAAPRPGDPAREGGGTGRQPPGGRGGSA